MVLWWVSGFLIGLFFGVLFGMYIGERRAYRRKSPVDEWGEVA